MDIDVDFDMLIDNESMYDDINSMDLDIDFNLDDFDILDDDDGLDTRYMKPVASKPFGMMKYEKARELADSIECEKDEKHFVIVSGNFIFGDFLEALIERKNIIPKKIYISTLSLSQDNVDSLVNIMEMRPNIQELNIIISNYFFPMRNIVLLNICLMSLIKRISFKLPYVVLTVRYL